MSDSRAFELACDALERIGAMDRLAARGTVRIALKQAGLDARSVTADQMRVAASRVLPSELKTRGVADPAAVEKAILAVPKDVRDDAGSESPEAVFARLGGKG